MSGLSTIETLVCELTPPGRGAVASVAVAGEAGGELVERFFRSASGKRLSELPLGRVVYGRWLAEGDGASEAAVGEGVVVCRVDPRRVEIHCHGGRAAAAAIRQSLTSAGCSDVDWRRWLAAIEPDPIAADAHAALAEARTRRAAAILLDQHAGALRKAVRNVLAEVEAHNADGAKQRLDDLLRFAPLGRRLIRPWRVVLAGRPNVGKSSLINALLGFRRAIVHDLPGVTRDVLTAQTALDGWPVELADTAGIRESGDVLEAAGIAGARRELSAADVVVLVFDAGQAWSAEDDLLHGAALEAITVHNKCDLQSRRDDRPAGISTCALSGEGLPDLKSAIIRRIAPHAPPPGGAVPFTSRQIEALRDARRRLDEGDLSSAAAGLRSLL
ncbi:MAG: 50S ribosome-binding GTPase [Planctomycetes bacterium]|nr:50S ribosome-binding GTPase [Planctomycetota bacterium]